MSGIIVSGDYDGAINIVAPVHAGAGVLTLPVATDTLVGKATIDTLTNKTLTAPILTDPALGTPASGNLAHCTFPTLNQNTAGTAAGLSATLSPASGGTGTQNPTLNHVLIGGGTNPITGIAPGATGNVLTSDGATWHSIPSVLGLMQSGVVNAGGTNPFPPAGGPSSIIFSGIPSTTKQIQLWFYGVKLNTAGPFLVQLGTSAGIVSAGYNSTSLVASISNAGTVGSSSAAGFIMEYLSNAYTYSGLMTLTKVTGDGYSCGGTMQSHSTRITVPVGQSPDLGSSLTQIKITTTGGASIFNAGSIQIFYL